MKIKIKYLLPFYIFLFSTGFLVAQDTTTFEISVTKYLMGTTVQTTARSTDINASKLALLASYKEMSRVENLLSSHKDDSEISKVNIAAGIHPVKVSYETFSLLKRAAAFSAKYDGLFDVTIGPVSNLWGFNEDQKINLPHKNDIEKLLKLVNFKNIVLNDKDTTVFLTQKGMAIDLGGIAKGYAVDRGAAVMKKMGIRNFILNAGGDIYVSGTKDSKTDWKIGIRHPRHSNKLIAEFNLHDFAVATSGDYERYKIINGKRYHHILNPADGYPGALSESSTVLAPTVEQADAAATFLFLLGWEKAITDKSIDFPFLIVSSNGEIHYNDYFADDYNLKIIK